MGGRSSGSPLGSWRLAALTPLDRWKPSILYGPVWRAPRDLAVELASAIGQFRSRAEHGRAHGGRCSHHPRWPCHLDDKGQGGTERFFMFGRFLRRGTGANLASLPQSEQGRGRLSQRYFRSAGLLVRGGEQAAHHLPLCPRCDHRKGDRLTRALEMSWRVRRVSDAVSAECRCLWLAHRPQLRERGGRGLFLRRSRG